MHTYPRFLWIYPSRYSWALANAKLKWRSEVRIQRTAPRRSAVGRACPWEPGRRGTSRVFTGLGSETAVSRTGPSDRRQTPCRPPSGRDLSSKPVGPSGCCSELAGAAEVAPSPDQTCPASLSVTAAPAASESRRRRRWRCVPHTDRSSVDTLPKTMPRT